MRFMGRVFCFCFFLLLFFRGQVPRAINLQGVSHLHLRKRYQKKHKHYYIVSGLRYATPCHAMPCRRQSPSRHHCRSLSVRPSVHLSCHQTPSIPFEKPPGCVRGTFAISSSSSTTPSCAAISISPKKAPPTGADQGPPPRPPKWFGDVVPIP